MRGIGSREDRRARETSRKLSYMLPTR